MSTFKKCIKVWKYLYEKENYISVESLKTNPDQEYYKLWFIKTSLIYLVTPKNSADGL